MLGCSRFLPPKGVGWGWLRLEKPLKTVKKTLMPLEFQILNTRNEIFDIDMPLGGAGVVVLRHNTPQRCLPRSQSLAHRQNLLAGSGRPLKDTTITRVRYRAISW